MTFFVIKSVEKTRAGLAAASQYSAFIWPLLSADFRSIDKSKAKAHLLIDATYFLNDLCLVLYYEHDIRYTLLCRMTDQERYEQMREDLENLKIPGVDIASITCDGHKALLKAIRKVSPNVPVQRCLAHIKRQSGTWLTNFQKPCCTRVTAFI